MTGAAGATSDASAAGGAGGSATAGAPGTGGAVIATGGAGTASGAGTAGAGEATGGGGTTGGAGSGVTGTGTAGASIISPPSSTDGGARVEVAHIRETASTNTPEINVSVYGDASAERKVGVGNVQYVADKSYAAASPEVLEFLAELHVIGDVSMIPTANDCAKSASFGTRTIVSADGLTSGDLQCLLATAPDVDVQLALGARKLDGTIQ